MAQEEKFLYLATYCCIKIWNNYGKKRKQHEWNLRFEEKNWYCGNAGKVGMGRWKEEELALLRPNHHHILSPTLLSLKKLITCLKDSFTVLN